MNIEELRHYCLSFNAVEETTPFGPDTLVFKVMGKMFALVSLDETPLRCNLKCNSEQAIELRETFTGVVPGYHMNKTHWNTLVFDGSFSETDACDWITDSYNLIVSSLSKRQQSELKALK